jgi:hypothetical protein
MERPVTTTLLAPVKRTRVQAEADDIEIKKMSEKQNPCFKIADNIDRI